MLFARPFLNGEFGLFRISPMSHVYAPPPRHRQIILYLAKNPKITGLRIRNRNNAVFSFSNIF
ncbi:MAG TPA: hypothetical protein VF884_07000, partial [Nitrososphaeraceae archaeon]